METSHCNGEESVSINKVLIVSPKTDLSEYEMVMVFLSEDFKMYLGFGIICFFILLVEKNVKAVVEPARRRKIEEITIM